MESPFFRKRSNPELWSGNTDSMTRDYPRTPNPREYQLVRIPIKATTCKQDQGMTQLATALYAGCLIQTTNKTKIQTQSSADRTTASHKPAHQRRKKKNSLPPTRTQTQVTSYTKPDHKKISTTKLVQPHPLRAETKRKKEFNLEA